MVQYLQPRNAASKLGVYDNEPWAIDKVEFRENGLLLCLSSVYKGHLNYVVYKDLDELRKDFKIFNSLREAWDYVAFDKSGYGE